MPITNTEQLIIGKIGKSFGVDGWIKIHSFTDVPSAIFQYQPWQLQNANAECHPCTIVDYTIQGHQLLVKFAHIHSPEEAKLLTNQFIVIDKNKLPALNANEYYWSDLIGLHVYDVHGTLLGTVTSLIETGSNDCLIVETPEKVITAIPFRLNDIVKSVDLTHKRMLVDWELL